jgi:hypothetical protein
MRFQSKKRANISYSKNFCAAEIFGGWQEFVNET